MKRNLLLFVLLFGIWLLWSGHFTPMLMGFGLISCALVMWISLRAGLLDEEGAPITITWRLLQYLPWLFKETLLANWDVAKRVIRGRKAINPQWVIVDGSQQTNIGFVIYANSITLTPGTSTVDLQGRGLLVHAIADEPAAGLRSGEMDRRVKKVEGLS